MNLNDNSPCPCGSDLPYAACCGLCHDGLPASTPEALMRSRFTAFVLGLEDYLLQSWHPSTRPAQLNLEGAPNWQSLQILSADEQGDQGQVSFRATYRAGDSWGFLEEDSRFVREDGHWFYVSGDTREGALKPGRNDPCPCGSDRKYKACCL